MDGWIEGKRVSESRYGRLDVCRPLEGRKQMWRHACIYVDVASRKKMTSRC